MEKGENNINNVQFYIIINKFSSNSCWIITFYPIFHIFKVVETLNKLNLKAFFCFRYSGSFCFLLTIQLYWYTCKGIIEINKSNNHINQCQHYDGINNKFAKIDLKCLFSLCRMKRKKKPKSFYQTFYFVRLCEYQSNIQHLLE